MHVVYNICVWVCMCISTSVLCVVHMCVYACVYMFVCVCIHAYSSVRKYVTALEMSRMGSRTLSISLPSMLSGR